MDWPYPDKDLARSRHAAGDCVPPVYVRWTSGKLAARLVANDVQVSGGRSFVVSGAGALFALANDGTSLWKWQRKEPGMRPVAPPFVHAGRVHLCREGFVHCLDGDGAEVWRIAGQRGRDVHGGKALPPDEWDFTRLAGIVGTDLVFGSSRGALRWIDARTGAISVRHPLWSPYLMPAGNRVLACVRPDRTLAHGRHCLFDLQTRTCVGDLAAVIGGGAGFCTLGDGGFLANRRELVAIDLRDGAVRWRTPLIAGAADHAQRLACDDDAVYWNHDHALAALDPVDGRVRWHTDPTHGPIGGNAITVGDRFLYLIRSDGSLEILDKTDGSPRWRGMPWGEGQRVHSLSLCDGLLYAVGEQQVVCLHGG